MSVLLAEPVRPWLCHPFCLKIPPLNWVAETYTLQDAGQKRLREREGPTTIKILLGEDRVEKRSTIADDCPGYSAAYFSGKLLTKLLYLWEVHHGMDFIEVYEVVTSISKEHPEESHVCCNVLL